MIKGKKVSLFIIQLFLFLLFLWPAPYKKASLFNKTIRTSASTYLEGEILVKFHKLVHSREIQSLIPGLSRFQAQEFSYISQRTQKSFYLIRSNAHSVDELQQLFTSSAEVEAISFNYRRELSAIPNDPQWAKQWGMQKISAPQAWDLAVGSPDVVVGVIDSGIDYSHEDLISNMWINPSETPNNGIDDDHNGYLDDYYGFNFAADEQGNNDSDPMDKDSHGSHVAGVIAASGNNGIGIAGINWNAKLMALRILRPDKTIYDSDAIEAIEYAIKMKRDYHINIVALNASWGGSSYNQLLKEIIDEAGSADIVFVAAAGNGGDDDIGDNTDQNPFYPASYSCSNILSVAASTPDDQLADFSNYGPATVDLAAPGTNIYSTVPMGTVDQSLIVTDFYSLEALALEYSGKIPTEGITGQLIDCGKGIYSSDFPVNVTQNIAFIERGESKFREKVTLAQNAGAKAVIIYNNESGNFSGTLCDSGDIPCQQFPWIPAISISQEDGQLLKSSIPISVTLKKNWSSYSYMEGTSMATPHVTGVVALVAAYYPRENYTQRMGRILAGCDSVSNFEGKLSTGGRLNALQAMKMTIPVALLVSRKTAMGWLVEQEVGLVRISVDIERIDQISGYRFIVQRKEQNSLFSNIKEISASELSNGVYEFYDKYLDKKKLYIYVVQVYDSSATLIGKSNQQTI